MSLFRPFRLPTEPGKPIHGLWWDMSPSRTLGKGYGPILSDLGIHEICVMSDHQMDDPIDSIWDIEDIEALVREMVPHKIAVSVTTWPQPQEPIIDEIVKWAPKLHAVGVWALEFDCEGGNWSSGHLRDYISLSAAGYDLVKRCRRAAPEMKIAANFHTGNRRASVSDLVDFVAVQAYSRYKESDPARYWDARYGPGHCQKRAIELASNCKESAFTIVGLSAYQQKFPDHSIEEAMTKAYQTARDEGAQWFRWWSAKHVVGHRANGYSKDFIQSLSDETPG